MFLFSTPPARATAPATPVVDAIRKGAEQTGTGFDYLLATAQRESSLDPSARARSSSATGLFQFIEQTWLGLVKQEGGRIGLGPQAAAITARADGTFAVEDPAQRQAILKLREDPQTASVMAGLFTQKNKDMLTADLGREPTRGDLYIAHFLGPKGASDLIRAAQRTPDRPAANDFPEAASANRSIFYDRSGRARGAAEVHALLAASHAGASNVALVQAGGAKPAAAPDEPAFHGLFRTGERAEPVSQSVAKLWRRSDPSPTRTASLGGFFPRSVPVETAAEASETVPTAPPSAASAVVPLPPPRPPELSARAGAGTLRAAAPLDLAAFMKARRP